MSVSQDTIETVVAWLIWISILLNIVIWGYGLATGRIELPSAHILDSSNEKIIITSGINCDYVDPDSNGYVEYQGRRIRTKKLYPDCKRKGLS